MPLLLLMSVCLFGCVVLSSFKGETVTANQEAGSVRQNLLQELEVLKKQVATLISTLQKFEQ